MAHNETAPKTDSPPQISGLPLKKKIGRPPADQDRIPRVLSFFDKVASIPKEDWGPRARIKIYRTEPSIDRVSLGKKRYIKDSLQPIDEDAIKRATWGGSGSYRLYLTYKLPSEREGKELDSIEVDILDTEYPPRLEPGEWLDLPENNKWKWAKAMLEPAPAAPQTSMSSIVEVINATNEIRKTAIEEMRQAAPAQTAANPMVDAMTLAEKLLTLRADNPMVSVMADQLTTMRAELAASRERSDRLMEKLSERNNAPEVKTDPLATVKSIFETFKSVREQAADVMPSGGGRSRLGPWMEFFQPVLPGIVDMLKPVAVAIAQQGNQPNPTRPQQIQQPPPQPQQEDFAAFLDIITPRMFHFLRDYEDPAPEFAAWFHDGWGPTAQRAVDTISAMGGLPALMNFYRASKYWPQIAPVEPQFAKFIADVIAWKPENEEAPASPAVDATSEPVIDLEVEPEAN